MKRIYIIPILALFAVIFCGCESTFVPWDDFPVERFKSYFPYTENQEIRFIKGENETLVFTVNKSEYSYSESREAYNCDCGNNQSFIEPTYRYFYILTCHKLMNIDY